ncbi:regulator of G-protein signaling 9-like [Stegastes partitus]|uniref:Regulator of G-protein signaling 9-like n=1 Tax=Stegastes partitus TaxID=144197 RepID=A0A9Y4N650_9TELE|nr:PREDICTED: regulator of G-protein signaling 9-like [Stegastes partitus]
MTIRTTRPDRVQHFRPRMHCLKKVEAIVVEMQDQKGGVKGSEQKLNVTTIPHVLAGSDIIAWIANKMKTTPEEAQAFGTMLVAYGYIYPLQNHKKLVMCNDTSLYRFQVESIKAALKQKVANRSIVYLSISQKITFDQYRRQNIFYQQAIMRSKVKSSVSIGALVKYITTYKNHDPFLAPCLPSNPWQTDHDAYWSLNTRRVDLPTKMRVERWSFSLFELLSDLRGRDDFKIFLKKEFSGENLAFWEAAEELKLGTASSMSTKAETIFKTFLAPGAPRWINIDGRTMGLTVKGLDHPHRYVLEAAQTHVFLLMKKDTFFRYLKSPVYKDIQKKALNPETHNFSPAQLEQNANSRSPGIHPIILWQQEEEEKAKAAAASAPVDVKAVMSKIDRKK